jgi:hypothetical protein
VSDVVRVSICVLENMAAHVFTLVAPHRICSTITPYCTSAACDMKSMKLVLIIRRFIQIHPLSPSRSSGQTPKIDLRGFPDRPRLRDSDELRVDLSESGYLIVGAGGQFFESAPCSCNSGDRRCHVLPDVMPQLRLCCRVPNRY